MPSLVLFPLWAWLLLIPNQLGRTAEARGEIDVLLEMKTALDPEGGILTSWTIGKDPCGGSFLGVACNDKGHVANLSLQGSGLTGTIPVVVAELTDLTGLYLHYNKLQDQIPGSALARLKGLTEVYLNVNLLSGTIPSELASLSSLQVLQLCCNDFNGRIPEELSQLRQLKILALQHNHLTDDIPSSFGGLSSLTHLDLSFNVLSGSIPSSLGNLSYLKVFDVRNNNLSGSPPPELHSLNQAFFYSENSWLCGNDFAGLPACNSSELQNPESLTGSFSPDQNAMPFLHGLPKTPKKRDQPKSCLAVIKVSVIAGVVAIAVGGILAMSVSFVWSRRLKQKIRGANENGRRKVCEERGRKISGGTTLDLLSMTSNQSKFCPNGKTNNPIYRALTPVHGTVASSSLRSFGYEFEELEVATNFFSKKCLLGGSNHGAIYKANLANGSTVIVKHINKTSFAAGEAEFQSALEILKQLSHENIATVRGICISGGGAHCYLVYDFVPYRTLHEHLYDETVSSLDWVTRVHIAYGVAKGLEYLHSKMEHPVLQHTIWTSNVLLDEHYNVILSDWGLTKIISNEVLFADIKMSAAMGYLAPEYALTGHLDEKTDIFAFGVVLLELLTGRKPVFVHEQSQLVTSTRSWVKVLFDSGHLHDVVDQTLRGKFSTAGAISLINLAFFCMSEVPGDRPVMTQVVQHLFEVESLGDVGLEFCLSSGEDYSSQQQAAYAEMLESGR
ncbi:hypothetical protein O6H91_04G068000 [Diphasiastrum complanatum]|uniref:Uncharacterized protein n=1 Tax=Diphasiastrum complanatum TaxID=34168 RepID=A0ACC2DXX8_DIPCM|nr:hypothetical protein O6H91_04G068000 [Diphasiastrum complanatum]